MGAVRGGSGACAGDESVKGKAQSERPGSKRRSRKRPVVGRVRRERGPRASPRRTILGFALFGAVAFAVAVFLVHGGVESVRAHWLARENRILESELRDVRARLADFEEQMDDLAERERLARLVAGRSGIDAEVFEVGVGGPGLASPEAGPLWPLDSVASTLAYATRFDLSVLERKARLLDESLTETTLKLEENRRLGRSMPAILPARGALTSPFTWRRLHPIHQVYLPHLGIDVYNVTGTPIVATGDGTVTFAGWNEGFGRSVEIDHGNGIKTVYAHASKLLVYRGKRVRRHEVIAQIGCTGVCTAPHVHYEVRVHGRHRDPMRYVLDFDTP